MTLLSAHPASAPARAAAQPAALPVRAGLRLVLGAAAIGAGVIHLAFGPEHVREYLPLGIGFLIAGVLQIGWGAAVAVRDAPRLLRAGGLTSLLFVAVYVMSRTTGLPLGPDAFRPEAFGRADLLCCALEVPVAVGALLLGRRPHALRAELGMRLATVLGAALLLVGSATTLALAAPAHTHADSTSSATAGTPCPAAPVRTGVLDARGVDTGVTSFFACQLQHEHDGHAGH
jgi:hypothetical protein